jgi:hypothetical protein
LTRIDGTQVCERCALRRHLDRVLPPDSVGVLHPLREAILRAEPLTTRRWLDRAHQLLGDVHYGRIPLDHATLDRLPQRKAVEHLRALMISCEIMPADEGRELRWLENDLTAMLADLDGAHSQVVTAWIRWAVLPRLRRRLADGRELTTSVTNDRRKIEQVVAFLLVLQTQGMALDQCGQHDLDTWFAGPGVIRGRLRPFLAWTQRRKHLPAALTLPPTYKGKPVVPLDAEQRWSIARRLVEDDTLDPADRVAGALVVLYAQPIARIITLTTADVVDTDGQVQLRLGPDALDLPEPFATLIRLLPRRRRESSAQQVPNPWAVRRNPRRATPERRRARRAPRCDRHRTTSRATGRRRPAQPRDPTRDARRRPRTHAPHRLERHHPSRWPMVQLPRRSTVRRSIQAVRICRSCQLSGCRRCAGDRGVGLCRTARCR